jgi:helicase
MRVSDLDLDERFMELLGADGVDELYPPQELSVKAGIMAGESLIVCTPTASGKTIASELGMIKSFERGKKAVYVVPLRALAYEKYAEFRKYEKLGYKVRLEVGDLDSSKYVRRPDFDIMIATAEKCDSILRSKPEWFEGAGIIVFDEIHLIATDRGPVYEILAARFKNLHPNIQVIGLSATIGNAQEMAGWLEAKLVASDWRPVRLEEKVLSKTDISLEDAVKKHLGDGQVLVFVNSRKSAEAVAEKMAAKLNTAGENAEAAQDVLDAINPPTRQCNRLAKCVRGGAAFHHAGLVNSQRQIVEEAFKAGKIRVIAATPTLAAGVNLPARTVVIRDVKRYTANGLAYISVLEYKQMAGRAGRPKYDSMGTCVTLAKNPDEKEYMLEHYVEGKVEAIYSQLGIHPVLRFHTLASIASGFTRSRESLTQFIKTTFFGFQYGVKADLQNLLDAIVSELIGWGFLEEKDRLLLPTPVGQRVSQLYIDPLSARNYLTLFEKASAEEKHNTLALLEVLCDAVEIPKLNVKPQEEASIWSVAYDIEGELLRDISGFGLDYDFLNRFKTALMFSEWLDEASEEEILEKYGIAPGQLNMRLTNLEWLTYAAGELAGLKKIGGIHPILKSLQARVKYGVRKELVPLVSIRHVGRARARKLYESGFKTVLQVKKSGLNELSSVVGEKTAMKIKEQL